MYIKIENLSFKYRNSNDYVINHFNMDIEKGETISILGQSGSGKSTLLRLISGLESPQSGSITINNQIIVNDQINTEHEKRGIGMVFQDYALFPHMTIEKNVAYGLKNMSKAEKKKRVQEVLQLVNLSDYNHRYPHELSGGQQQRVALARALAPSPSLLLLDEPFSNLDSDLRVKIRDELKIILKQANITSIFVTHDKEDAKVLADRIVNLDKGNMVK